MPSVIDPKDLRNAFGKFPTGVTIVTTMEESGIPRGFTANSFTSVSLDPPLLLICIDNRAISLPVFLQSEGFVVNILSADQKDSSGLFATQRVDKFDVTPWHKGVHGMPVIDQSLAWFECVPEQHLQAGDHMILIGRILHYEYSQQQPLGYASGGYFSLGMDQSIVDAASQVVGISVGALLECDGRLLLKNDGATNKFSLPMIGGVKDQSREKKPGLQTLVDELSAIGLSPAIDFLFAVYEDKKTGSHVVCYRGEITGEAPDGYQYFGLNEIPWDRLINYPTQSMLERYVKEHKFGRFAVYFGDDQNGKVQALNE